LSHPVGTDACACGQALGNRLEGGIRLLCDPVETAQSKAVNDLLASALGANKAAVAQTRQVGADPRLGLPDRCHQLADGEQGSTFLANVAAILGDPGLALTF